MKEKVLDKPLYGEGGVIPVGQQDVEHPVSQLGIQLIKAEGNIGSMDQAVADQGGRESICCQMIGCGQLGQTELDVRMKAGFLENLNGPVMKIVPGGQENKLQVAEQA